MNYWKKQIPRPIFIIWKIENSLNIMLLPARVMTCLNMNAPFLNILKNLFKKKFHVSHIKFSHSCLKNQIKFLFISLLSFLFPNLQNVHLFNLSRWNLFRKEIKMFQQSLLSYKMHAKLEKGMFKRRSCILLPKLSRKEYQTKIYS